MPRLVESWSSEWCERTTGYSISQHGKPRLRSLHDVVRSGYPHIYLCGSERFWTSPIRRFVLIICLHLWFAAHDTTIQSDSHPWKIPEELPPTVKQHGWIVTYTHTWSFQSFPKVDVNSVAQSNIDLDQVSVKEKGFGCPWSSRRSAQETVNYFRTPDGKGRFLRIVQARASCATFKPSCATILTYYHGI